MNPQLLHDPRLLFLVVASAVVTLLQTLTVAARPAAILTGRVAQATTISSLVFIVTRLANMFYLPLMAGFVSIAEATGGTGLLLEQIRWIVLGCAFGGLGSWLLLPNFISLYCHLVEQLDQNGTRVLLDPRVWLSTLKHSTRRTPMKARLGQLHGIPTGFLISNVFATSVWTVGALCAIFCSVLDSDHKSTALLLSGLVNSFAAIAFSVLVDPQAALLTDDAVKKRKPAEQVDAAAVHLAFGNFLGALCGLAVLPVGISIIAWATKQLGEQGGAVEGSILWVVLLNALLTTLLSTAYASRVSAVTTGQIATALAVYNLFNLVTRLSQQVYNPIMGSLADHLVHDGQVQRLEHLYRMVLGGAALGAFIGLLLLPTFVQIINHAIGQLQKRGSITRVLLACLYPASWPTILGSLRPPGLLGVKLSDLRYLPKPFLVGNILVISIQSCGSLAAVFAGAHLPPEAARCANLLSSVVNGLATITLGFLVDPTLARITDRCSDGSRDPADIRRAAVFLLLGMFLGSLLSQVVFGPAAWIISQAAILIVGVWKG